MFLDKSREVLYLIDYIRIWGAKVQIADEKSAPIGALEYACAPCDCFYRERRRAGFISAGSAAI